MAPDTFLLPSLSLSLHSANGTLDVLVAARAVEAGETVAEHQIHFVAALESNSN